jgi:hypothetical protein
MAAVLRQLLIISGYETPPPPPSTKSTHHKESRSQDWQNAVSGEWDVGIEIATVKV